MFILALMVLAGCGNPSPVATRHAMSLPAELVAIDSLMQTRPDSALTMLLDSPMDDHYYQLLLSEALYKNDSAQLNRSELLQAMAYYDSVDNAYLSARCHYMNGVGYYEMDSVVPACAAYLKALEIMEDHFKDEELVERKAQFMAMIFTRLYSLFSNQYLHEQALDFGKTSLVYYYKYNASPRHIAWILDEIGSHYDMLNNYDSAGFYYRKSLNILPDTNNLTYRDIETRVAFLSYKMEKTKCGSLDRLQRLLEKAESEKEILSRYAIIGEIFYHEKEYDSAKVYLNRVFQESQSVDSRKQAAEWLVEIFEMQGKDSETFEYASFLAPFATKDENKSGVRSHLSELYNIRKRQEIEQLHLQKNKIQRKRLFIFILGLSFLALSLFVLYQQNKRKKRYLETQIKEDQYTHELKQKALSGRLRHSNEALRLQKQRAADLAKKINIQQRQKDWDNLNNFMKEEICQEILIKLSDKTVKREAKKTDYPELRLSDAQLHELYIAVEKHFNGFEVVLIDLFNRINRNEMNQCMLYLLNLDDTQIAALLSCDYSTVKRRSSNLTRTVQTDKELRLFIRELVL